MTNVTMPSVVPSSSQHPRMFEGIEGGISNLQRSVHSALLHYKQLGVKALTPPPAMFDDSQQATHAGLKGQHWAPFPGLPVSQRAAAA